LSAKTEATETLVREKILQETPPPPGDEDNDGGVDTISFAKKMDGKKVMFEEVVDSAILGGVIIEAEHQIFDGSIRLNLETLKKQIMK
ncbi:MAG: F0F1 ATP synthase subunit delta, partial [Carnobacterium sp.]